ncbi:TPA: hypothetical protein ACIYX1_004626 [Escherichia coli]|nr:hypothetical protein [Escherichia coli]HCX4216783.1 hypothetical protein [Escherichia coli]
MSELKTDNPAQRLLDLFEQENEYQITDNCRKVWQKSSRANAPLQSRLFSMPQVNWRNPVRDNVWQGSEWCEWLFLIVCIKA